MQEFMKKLIPIEDEKIKNLKKRFFSDPQKIVSRNEFIEQADNWFMATKLNQLHNVDQFPNKDIIIGCTQFIESLALKNKWNIQILPRDYAYYAVMGKRPTEIGSLEPEVPLIVSIPNYYYGPRPKWNQILEECENKNIDVHIDCAWITVSKDINLDFGHPNIKSFGMSLSKYIGSWNRIGLRYSKQKSMDSITMFNAQQKYNDALISCGSLVMDNIERDYGWNTYGEKYKKICKDNNLQETNFFYVAKKDGECVSVSEQLISK